MRPILLLLALAVFVAGCAGSDACGGDAPPPVLAADHPLLNPDSDAMRQIPPDSFDMRLATTKGDVVIRFHHAWSPAGVQRVWNLARHGLYDGSYSHRVLP